MNGVQVGVDWLVFALVMIRRSEVRLAWGQGDAYTGGSLLGRLCFVLVVLAATTEGAVVIASVVDAASPLIFLLRSVDAGLPSQIC